MTPILFCNVGWMDRYEGMVNDSIKGGGENNEKTGWLHEIFNFKSYRRNFYGFVQPVISENTSYMDSKILIERLGAEKEDNFIKGVTVVWKATDPDHGGAYIGGWYKNATVYRNPQFLQNDSERIYEGEKIGYFSKAKIEDSTLLPRYERIFRIPRSGPGSMGRSNVWYAHKMIGFQKQVLAFIHDGKKPNQEKTTIGRKGGSPRQPDPEKRIKVEVAAVKYVIDYFTKLGYLVDSKEKDNVGWDLEATSGQIFLRIEVKGLSGKKVIANFTPQ